MPADESRVIDMRRPRFALIVLAQLAVALLCPNAHSEVPEITGHAIVGDGDTMLVGKDTIRLAGIDAPELGQKCRRAGNIAWDCGLDARRMLAEMIGDKPVSCRQLDFDPYGRILAICAASNGDDLSAAMVHSGYALADGRDQLYLAEEKAARLGGEGLWSGSFQTPWEWRAERLEAEEE